MTPPFSDSGTLKADNSRYGERVAGTAFGYGCSGPRDRHKRQFAKYRILEQAVFLMAYRDIIP